MSDGKTSTFCNVVVDSLNRRVLFTRNDSTLYSNMVVDTCKGVMCHYIMEYNIIVGYMIPQRDLVCARSTTPTQTIHTFLFGKYFPINTHQSSERERYLRLRNGKFFMLMWNSSTKWSINVSPLTLSIKLNSMW